MAKKKREKRAKRTKSDGARDAIADLERRLAAVESRLRDAPTAGAAVASGGPAVGAEGDRWAVSGVRDATPAPGGVVFAGAVDLPTGEHVELQRSARTTQLVDDTWTAAADQLAALAHPVRLELLRQVLRGVGSTAELGALGIVGTTGQLYHHLKELMAAGWLERAGRGRYTVPAKRIVPVLVVVAAAGP